MKYYEFTYTNYEGEEKTIKLRLVSADMKIIEKNTKTRIIDYVQDYSITAITNMLRYMSRPAIPNFSEKDADTLFDELIDSGLTLENIMENVIMETLVVSGFMSKKDLDDIKTETKEKKEEERKKIKTPRE